MEIFGKNFGGFVYIRVIFSFVVEKFLGKTVYGISWREVKFFLTQSQVFLDLSLGQVLGQISLDLHLFDST